VALRCRIILGAVAGEQNVAIAEKLGVSRPTVLLWRQRVREQGIGEVLQIPPDGSASRSTIKPRASGSSKRPCTVSPRG
jgi:transposase